MSRVGLRQVGLSNDSDVRNYIQPFANNTVLPLCSQDIDHLYARAEVNDVIHITTGGGGAPLSTPGSDPNLVTFATSAHHFCKVEIDNEMLIFTVVKPEW